MKNFREYLNTLLQPMRHVMAWCVLWLLFAAGTAGAQATFEVNGITYQTLTGSTVQVGDGSRGAINFDSASCIIPARVNYNGINYTVTSIGDKAFLGCRGLTSMTFPDTVTSIGNQVFWCSSGLRSVTFPASLRMIGDEAFLGCTGLTSVKFPASLRIIGAGAFKQCVNLTSVTFPESLTSIGEEAFFWCQSLTSVKFPDSLRIIGDNAFCGCSKLADIYYLGSSEPSIEGWTFMHGPANRVLHVPNATGGFYAEKWWASSVVYGGEESNDDDKTPANAKSPSAASEGGKSNYFRYLCLLGFVVFFIYGTRKWGGAGAGNSKK